MNGLLAGRVAIRLIFLIVLLILALDAGPLTRVAIVAVALVVALDAVRLVRQGPAAQGNLVAAKYTEPGEYRVVLQVRGGNPMTVIREIRRTTGKPLLDAKQVADDAPSIVAEGLSDASAAAVVERLQRAGARAVAAPMEAST